mmetsp:Transcript_22321/g.49385  ORF Transcript_22321/g.49385 Transcript_22321/m.49385 type:complete len:262 (+) Transcript_22321:1200-1985(+)
MQGQKKTEEGHVTSGGRVLAVTGTGPCFTEALKRAYAGVDSIKFTPEDGLHCRRDIGKNAIKRPLSIALVGSTRGSSSQTVIDSIKEGTLDARIVAVLSNKADAGILERAQREGLKGIHVPCKKGTERAVYDSELTKALKDEGVELVLFVGFMRILSPEFCNEWSGRLINVHPSLLPKHAGLMDLDVHKSVLDAGDQESGCTVHVVTAEVDGGPTVVQRKVGVSSGDTPEMLKAKVQAEEGPALVDAIRLFPRGLGFQGSR